jgi:hypothetical protein
MKKQQSSQRQGRTRTLIQAGGLLQKSGLMDAFLIVPGDDLQEYENLEKASRLLGFLSEYFEASTFNEDNLEKWSALGSRLLKPN